MSRSDQSYRRARLWREFCSAPIPFDARGVLGPPSRRAISCRDITLVDTDKIKLSPLAVEVSISLLLLFLAHPRTMTQPLEEIGSPATSGTRSAPLFPTVYTFDSRSYGAAYNKNFTLAIFHVSFCCFLFDSI